LKHLLVQRGGAGMGCLVEVRAAGVGAGGGVVAARRKHIIGPALGRHAEQCRQPHVLRAGRGGAVSLHGSRAAAGRGGGARRLRVAPCLNRSRAGRVGR
jgi:membrane-associated phospholipid phosphatase